MPKMVLVIPNVVPWTTPCSESFLNDKFNSYMYDIEFQIVKGEKWREEGGRALPHPPHVLLEVAPWACW